ncbi:MAG: hypothetical protein J7K08_04310 [Thermoplasmata archaeon]|nr:hypothetical protein [Thermoplasmata archaeon]
MTKKSISGAIEDLLKNRERNLLILCTGPAFPGVARELLTSLAGMPGKKVFFGSLRMAKEVDLRRKAKDAYFVDQTELIFSLLRKPLEIESIISFLEDCDEVVFLGYRRLFDFLRSSGLYYRFAESLHRKRLIIAEIASEGAEKDYLPWRELVEIDEVVIAGADGSVKRHSLL